jgi:hypothetical protein
VRLTLSSDLSLNLALPTVTELCSLWPQLLMHIDLPPSCPVIHSPAGAWVSTVAALSVCISLIRFGYLHFIAGCESPLLRLILVLPLLLLQLITPLLFPCTAPTSMLIRCILTFSLSWMGAQKLIGLILQRGPMSSQRLRQYTTWQLVGVALLPVMPTSSLGKGRLQHKAGGGGYGLLARWLLKTLLLILICRVLVIWPPHDRELEPGLGFLRDLVLAGLSYTFLGFLLDYPGAIAVGVLGLDIVPTFDQPWMSSSLRDFWSNRWNVATSSLLRSLLFSESNTQKKVGRNGSMIYEIKRSLEVMVIFFSSGLLHEFAFWMVRLEYHQTNLRWMSFCLSSGIGLIIERAIVKSTQIRFPLSISIPLTTIILLGYGHSFSCSSEFEVLVPMFADANS